MMRRLLIVVLAGVLGCGAAGVTPGRHTFALGAIEFLLDRAPLS